MTATEKKVFIIPEEVERKYVPAENCIIFYLPSSKYFELLSREYVFVKGGKYKMPLAEISPYREVNLEDVVMGKNVVASFAKVEGEIILSRRKAIINQYSLYAKGDVIEGYISGFSKGGIFIDFGQGLRCYCSYEDMSNINYRSTNKPFYEGDDIKAVISKIDGDFPYHINANVKKAAKKKEVNISKDCTEIIRVIVGNPMRDGSGAFCEITPTQTGIMDAEEDFTPSKKYAGKEAWAFVKRIKICYDTYGNRVEKWCVEFIGWVDDEFKYC